MSANSLPSAARYTHHGVLMRVLNWIAPAPTPIRGRSAGAVQRTFEDAVRVFEADLLPTIKPKAATRYRVSIKALMKSFAGLSISAITTSNLQQFVSMRRQDGVQGTTIRRDLACLSLIMQQITSRGWLRANPCETSISEASRRRRPGPDTCRRRKRTTSLVKIILW